MRPIRKSFVAVALVGYIVAAVVVAEEIECDGPFKGSTPTPEELVIVLRNHEAWLKSGAKSDDTRRANLCHAMLVATNLSKADLRGANLQGAVLWWDANLQEADLSGANLQKASIHWTELQKANLDKANLQQAELRGANLHRASLDEAKLAGAIYEPKPESVPAHWTLTHPDSKLDELVFVNNPSGLIELRDAFKKAGMRTQERQLTYAIERTKRLQAWDPSWVTPDKKDTRT